MACRPPLRHSPIRRPFFTPAPTKKLLLALLLLPSFALRAFAANTALDPVPQRGSGFTKLHNQFLAEAKQGGIEVLFLRDSITDFWRDPARGKAVSDREYAPLHAANFGISADRTQNVLWRLDHGEVDGLSPKVVVLLIGTNNTGVETDGAPRNTTDEAIQGVTLIVHTLLTKLPRSKILLFGIFPRADAKGPPTGSTQIKDINAALAKMDDSKIVHYLDIGPKFLDADGKVTKDIQPDLLHPNLKGYEIWADAIREPLAALLKESAAPAVSPSSPSAAQP